MVPRGKQVAGVEADAEPLAAATGVDQLGELLERTPERAAGAGCVLEQERAFFGFGQCLLDDLSSAVDRLGHVACLRRAGVEDHADRVYPRADAQRLEERGERLFAH